MSYFHKFEAGKKYAVRRFSNKTGAVIECVATPVVGKAKFAGHRGQKLYGATSGLVDGVWVQSSEIFYLTGDLRVSAYDVVEG